MKILKRPSEPSRDPNEILHVTRASIPWLLEVLARTKDVVSGDTETWKCEVGEEHPAGRARATCVTLATEDFPNIYVDNWREEEGNILRLKPWFEDAGKPKVFHNAKFDMHVLLNHGIELRGLAGDTLVMDYMIDTSREGRHDLETCLLDWFGEEHKNYSETFAWHPPKKNGEPQKKAVTRPHYEWWDMGEHFMVMNYACKDTREGRRLYFHHKRRLEQTPWTGGFNYWEFYQKYWLPMTTVLFRMERRGCQVDLEYTAELDEYLEEVSVEAFRRFYGALRGTGLPTSYIEQLNPGSGPQMAELLFDKLGFVPSKLTPSKKGYAVDAEVLQELATLPKGGFLVPLLESREVAKLRGTYTQRFLKDAPFDNGRIHTNLGQTATVTGRLSCVAAGTLVRTQRGTVPVESVGVGDQVWTHRGRFRPVTRTVHKGFGVMYDVLLSTGAVLTCTGDHVLLRPNGSWSSLREVASECVDAVGQGFGEQGGGSSAVPRPDSSDDGTGSGGIGDDIPQRLLRREALPSRSGAAGVGSGEVLSIEDGGREPDAREDRNAASQLGGPVRGWVRVSHLYPQREEAVCSPGRDGAGVGAGGVTGASIYPSHRRGQAEQRVGQLGAGDYSGPQHPPFLVGEGIEEVTVQAIYYRGSCEVYDLSVAEDESYLSSGVFSHNSSGPNLQNIPIRSELGKLLRNCFGARPGYRFLGGDLSQIELIIAAHLSQDRVMLQYIREGLDLHSYTAYSVVPWLRAEVDAKFGGVTKEALKWVKKDHGNLRDRAKTLNYAVQYGAGQKRAASIFGTSEEEGAQAISRYMNGYTGMAAFIDAQHKRARRDGHVRTVLKRYCHLPHANSASFGMRKRAERQSVNYSIQGGAGDIISLGMLLIEDNPRLKELGYEMTLQIHDEITGEAPADAAQECQGIIQELMSNPYEAFGLKPLSVPTPAAVGIGTTWGNAKV